MSINSSIAGNVTPPRRSPVNEHAYTVQEETVFSPTTNLKLLASISFLTSRTDSSRFPSAPVDFCTPTKRSRDQNIFGIDLDVEEVVIDDGKLPKRSKTAPKIAQSKTESILNNTRKEKSLGLLCHKFLDTLSNDIGSEINLEATARILGSGKRRMYDIINVLESLCAVAKITKSRYNWLGLDHLPEYLLFLKVKGERDEWPKKIADMEDKLKKNADKSIMKAVRSVIDHQRHQDEESFGFGEDNVGSSLFHQRTSLINLCRRFLMLLLSTPYPHQLSMDVASALLVDSSNSAIEREHLARTRCRRMYDIANVLVGLKLVRKEYQLQYCRKIPILRYCGPNASSANSKFHSFTDDEVNFVTQSIDENTFPKQSFADILQAAELERQKLLKEKDRASKLSVVMNGSLITGTADLSGKSKNAVKQLQIVTKNGAKFIVKIKSVDTAVERKSMSQAPKLILSDPPKKLISRTVQAIVVKKKPLSV